MSVIKGVIVEGFREIEQKFLALGSNKTTDAMERKALAAAGNVIKEALIAATPKHTGDLATKVRMAIAIKNDGTASSVIVSHGKDTWKAHIIDVGHVNYRALEAKDRYYSARRHLGQRLLGSLTGDRIHTPAHPFIRLTEESTREEAAEAYISTMKEEITAYMEKK